jgi:uncharacterized protein (TIGR03435 family)
MRTFAAIGIAAMLSCTAFAQSTEKPVFEAAEIHPSRPTSLQGMNGPLIRGSRYELRNASMVDLIAQAYGIDPDFVYGGPTWMESKRYDIVAKIAEGTPRQTAKTTMLQNLLAERFQLTAHPDRKPVSVFVLSAGKSKHKLKATDGTASGCRPANMATPSGPPEFEAFSCHNLTTAMMATILRQIGAQYLFRTVVDQVKLDGAWDFDIKWTIRNLLPNAGADGISLFDAVDKQLGLKLELQTIPADVVAVDRVNDTPSDNLPGVAQRIPEAPTEFEVASVKPSAPGSQGVRLRVQPGGRIDAEGTLRDLLNIAYDFPANISTDLIADAPKFLDSDRYTIVAKAPGSDGANNGIPIDELRVMLRALIAEQFNMVTHTEDRETPVYAVVAGKGENKLKKADPTARSSCRLDVGSGKAIGTPGAYLCQNTTMPELAQLLQVHANAYMNHPGGDATGISGGWDFAIGWMPRAQLQTGPGEPGGMTIFEAVEKMLGLKLEQQKRVIPVIVIDHMDPKPKG